MGSSFFCPQASDKKLHSAGTGHSFRQNSMNLVEQAAGLHALRE